MKSREEKQQKTDKAWNELYARLEQDGLLPQADAPAQSPDCHIHMQVSHSLELPVRISV